MLGTPLPHTNSRLSAVERAPGARNTLRGKISTVQKNFTGTIEGATILHREALYGLEALARLGPATV